jgi:hypothetical protein
MNPNQIHKYATVALLVSLSVVSATAAVSVAKGGKVF